MKSVLILNKKEGETPLEALDNFRSKNKKYKYEKMTYAGRLDPMASGLLLVLAGAGVKNKDKYLALDKEYEFEILFGFATDTYDVLGKVTKYENTRQDLVFLVKNNLKQFTGKFIQKYPIYSSKTVRGVQLFEYARASKEVEIPEREVWVKNLKFLKLRKMSKSILLKNIEKRIKKVNIKNDFRQKEILKIWRKILSRQGLDKIFVGSFRVKCSSGTYVRGIANSLGEKIGIPTLAFSIKRTKIGKWR
jgi:tRNA pseudouridine55 synthase